MNSAVVVVIEGLGTGQIGAYGSSTSQTPALDQLAARGVVLDQCFVDSQDLLQQLRSLWTGQHALSTEQPAWNLWRHGPIPSDRARLLTDCEDVARLAAELGCGSITLVKPQLSDAPAETTSECALMELFATAAEELETGDPGLVWVHSRGLRLPWDAPLPLRRDLVDPEDPDPPEGVTPPNCDVDPTTDPDLLVGWGQVAAAQAAVLDEAVAALMDTVDSRSDAAEWSWLLATLGGVPLGEHGRLGWGRPQLHGEELHVAAILSPTQNLDVGLRRPELFQLPDLTASLLAMLRDKSHDGPSKELRLWGRSALDLGGPEIPARWSPVHSLAMIAAEQQWWIRTPAWSALLPREEDELDALPRLFVKPDDRWEAGDVATRRREIVEKHRELATVFQQAVERQDRDLLPVLDDNLCNLLR